MTKQVFFWDAISQIATHINIPLNTVAKWKERGFIPPSRHHEVVMGAQELAVPIDHAMLHNQWKKR